MNGVESSKIPKVVKSSLLSVQVGKRVDKGGTTQLIVVLKKQAFEMEPKNSLSSLSHTNTHNKTHTNITTTQSSSAGDLGGGGDASEDGCDVEEDGEQHGEVAMVVFQGEPLPLAAEFEKMGGRLEAESDEASSTGFRFDIGDGKGSPIDGKLGVFAAGSSHSKLGFRAAMESEKSPEEDEATPTDMEVVAMADDSRTSGEGEGVMPIEKDPNLDVEDGDLVRRPILGFGGANLNGSERLKSSFNMAEFLRLAHKVIDKNDHESTAALEELRLKWEMRFGKVSMLRCFPPEKMMSRTNVTDIPPTRTRRQAYRSLLPMSTMEKTTDTDGLQFGRSPMTVPVISDGLMMKEPPHPAKKVAGNPLRRTETNLTHFPAVFPASDVDGGSDVALGYGDVEADVEPNSAADLADDNDLAQRLDGHSVDISIARADDNVSIDAATDVISDAAADVIKEVGKKQLFATTMTVNVECNMANEKSFVAPVQTGLYVGNIPLNAYPEPIIDDKIAHAFNHSTRKTLKFIAPTLQNGEVILRPTLDTIRNGSKRWKTTAVGYFLGKRPYFHHLKEYAVSVWPGLREVTGTTNGFFFFQFKSVTVMEDIIKGGPWLFQGQPIVLQKWEPGMVLRKLKHTQVPVWIKLRHLPVELWTEEGLSIVASGVGKPLYPDAITRACTRLDFARVCVMLDVNSKMPKHIIIMTPDEEGEELPCKIDVEYEWLPPRCTSCMTLGHSAKECIVNKPKSIKPPVNVYVPKVGALQGPMVTERTRDHPTPHTVEKQIEDRGTRPTAAGPNREERETRVRINNCASIQSFLIPHWKWFMDYDNIGNRIWIAWDYNYTDVDIIEVGNQFIHYRATIRALQEYVDITIVYGATEVSDRRELWASLESLAVQCINTPWLVGGDFNAVRDLSEVCGTSGDIRAAMEEFNTCLQNTALLPLPMQGE
ncbi:UNVERIFIED_CONTAM: hypothetical protein Sindi_2961300 [Sesamum indicum]